MNSRRSIIARALLISSALVLGNAMAQGTFPEGTVRIVVPTTPGSTPDLLARAISQKLSDRIGRVVIVENRVGASGAIGAEAVVRAAPNGATLLLAASTLATGASLQKALPFDPVRDLTPIVLMGWSRLVLVTNPASGFKKIDDLLAAARKSPGRLTYGSPGNGTPNHLAAELFKVKTGVFMMHIPYRGSAQQITDILGGQIDMAPLTSIAAAPHVRAGKLVALAVTGDKRTPMLPGVPALSEVRIPGVDGNIWYGLFGPKGMPSDLVARLNTEVKDILQGEEKNLASQGFEVETGTPEEFRQLMVRDSARWAELIKAQNIRPE
jgi:tripartite-type tricarboxylate transporter receptor subunit TctC